MRGVIAGMAVIVAMACATAAPAAERAGAVSVSPFVGGYTFDGHQHLLTRPVYGLRLGYDWTRNFGSELVFDYVAGESTRSKEDLDAYSYRFDLLYNFMPEARLVPYAALGGGGTTQDRESGDDTSATMNYGVGAKYFVTDSMAVRGDIRHIVVFANDEETYNNAEYSIGLTFLFGGSAAATPGITPAAAPVAPSVPAAKAPTPTPVPDAGRGKEAPLAPVPVTEPSRGRYKYCISLRSEFDIDSAEIRPSYHQELAKVGDFMTKYPDTTAVIEGHTDEVGSDEYNMHLSQRRAEAIGKYLSEKFGIAPSRLTAIGRGKTDPVADNSTDEGKQKNRRINAIIDCATDVQTVAPPPDRLCMNLLVEFDSGRAEVKEQYRDEIAKVADFMKRYPTTTALIEGHTDNVGSPDENLQLSQRRADAVVDYLVNNLGIERSRLAAQGYGETRRIAYNATEEGRQKNRRINAVIDCVIKR